MDFIQKYAAEISKRFPVKEFDAKAQNQSYIELGRRYAETFINSPDVVEAASSRAALVKNAVLHCFHAGVIVALYERTEENYELSEKTFAVLTNMDTVFFSGLMFTRWNVKKRCVNYKTDETAAALWQVICALSGESFEEDDLLTEALTLVFLTAVAIDPGDLENPEIDLTGITE